MHQSENIFLRECLKDIRKRTLNNFLSIYIITDRISKFILLALIIFLFNTDSLDYITQTIINSAAITASITISIFGHIMRLFGNNLEKRKNEFVLHHSWVEGTLNFKWRDLIWVQRYNKI